MTVWSSLQTEMNRETMQYAQYIAIFFPLGHRTARSTRYQISVAHGDFPGGPVVKTLHFCRGTQVPSLVRELRFLHAMVWPEN